MKNLFAICIITFAFAACQKTDQADTDKSTEEITEQSEANSEELAAELAKFEFICDHCKLGSHEAGKCPCGMEYTKNANFVSLDAGGHDDGHGHDHGEGGHSHDHDHDSAESDTEEQS